MLADLVKRALQPTSLLALVAAVLVFRYLFVKQAPKFSPDGRRCEDAPLRKARYPLGIDYILNATKAVQEQRNPLRFVALCDDLGHTFRTKVLGTQFYITRDPKIVQTILATQFQDFGLSGDRKVHHALIGSQGIFTQDGPVWSQSRALLRPSFEKTQIANLSSVERYTQQLINILKEKPVEKDGYRPVELQILFQKLTMDASTDLLLGTPAGALDQEKQAKEAAQSEEQFTFSSAFDYAQDVLASRLPFGKFYWLVNPKRFQQACTYAHNYVQKYVSSVEQKLSTTETSEQKDLKRRKYVFLDALAASTSNKQVLEDQILNIILAGRDTTSSLLSWTFLSLSRHPEMLKKLRNEIEETIGVGENARIPEQEDLRGMKYLQWTMKEVLRLYPPVYSNSRYATKPTTLPTGGGPDGTAPIALPKGGRVIYSVFALQRRKDIYGEDANEFRPERWGEEKLRSIGWAWVPFNGGPRICLGQQYALTVAGFVITRLLQTFRDVKQDPNQDYQGPKGRVRGNGIDSEIKYDTKLVMFAGGAGVKVRLAESA